MFKQVIECLVSWGNPGVRYLWGGEKNPHKNLKKLPKTKTQNQQKKPNQIKPLPNQQTKNPEDK